MKKALNLCVATATALFTLSLLTSAASATPLVAGTGWQDDTADSQGSPSEGSPWTFIVGAGETDRFSISDNFVVGDIYEVVVSGDSIGTFDTAFTALPINFTTGLGDTSFDSAWSSGLYSQLQLLFGPGSYSLSISDTNCESDASIQSGATCPAGFAVRLDAVPEPFTLSLFGAGLAGAAAMRRRRRVATPA